MGPYEQPTRQLKIRQAPPDRTERPQTSAVVPAVNRQAVVENRERLAETLREWQFRFTWGPR